MSASVVDWSRPEWLWALALVPIAVGAVIWGLGRRRRALERFSEREVRSRTQSTEGAHGPLRGALLVIGLGALVLALAGPRWGTERVASPPVEQRIVFAVDVSRSMLARDARPDRLESAKRAVRRILAGIPAAEAGLVLFAGEASLSVPLTRDLGAVELYLDSTGPDWISDPSTDLGNAVGTAVDAFAPNPAPGRAVVVLTDGETHVGGVEAAAEKALERGVEIETIGIGTREGARIPLPGGGWLQQDGEPVVSRLEPEPLRVIARETGGTYVELADEDRAVGAVLARLRLLEAGEEAEEARTRRADRYRWPLALAVLCLALEFVLRFSSRRELEPVAAFALALFLLAMGSAPSPPELYREGRYRQALEAWRRADRTADAGPVDAYGRASAAYRLGEFREGAASYAVAARTVGTRERAAEAWYNAGNARFRIAETVEEAEGLERSEVYWDSAVAAYRESLLRNPDDIDAKHNLELALRRRDRAGGGGGGGGRGGAEGEGGGGGERGAQPPGTGSGSSGSMSRAQAERLLDALAAREKEALAGEAEDRPAGRPRRPGW